MFPERGTCKTPRGNGSVFVVVDHVRGGADHRRRFPQGGARLVPPVHRGLVGRLGLEGLGVPRRIVRLLLVVPDHVVGHRPGRVLPPHLLRRRRWGREARTKQQNNGRAGTLGARKRMKEKVTTPTRASLGLRARRVLAPPFCPSAPVSRLMSRGALASLERGQVDRGSNHHRIGDVSHHVPGSTCTRTMVQSVLHMNVRESAD